MTPAEQQQNDIPLTEFLQSLKAARIAMQKKIKKAIESKSKQTKYYQERLKEITKIYDEMLKIYNDYLNTQIPKQFKKASKIAEDFLKNKNLTKSRQLFQLPVLQAIIQNTMTYISNGIDNGKKDISQLFILTQQRLIQEETINRAIAEGMISGNTVQSTASSLEKKLKEQLLKNGRVITTNRITGKKRSFTPEYYAELTARTRTREAQSLGVINTVLEYDKDLVKVSSHNTETPLCRGHEGKIYSITGKTPGYEKYEGSNVVPFHPNSLAKGTEILTIDNGWKKVEDITDGMPVWTLNKDTQFLEKGKVISTIKHKKSRMIQFQSKDFHCIVTEDHDMLYETDTSAKKNLRQLNLVKANEIYNKKSGRFPRSCDGFSWDKKSSPKQLAHAFLYGFSIADGYYDRYAISIKQDLRNDIQISEIKNACEVGKISYTYANGRFMIRGEVASNLQNMGIAQEKFIPSFIRDMPIDCLKEFLRAYELSDGHRKKGKTFNGAKFNDSITYFTTSKKLADGIGEIILKIGGRPSYKLSHNAGKIAVKKDGFVIKSNHDCWIISHCTNKYATMQKMKTEIIAYNQNAYCLQVDINNTIYIRSNGKCTWTGNCWHVISPHIPRRKDKI